MSVNILGPYSFDNPEMDFLDDYVKRFNTYLKGHIQYSQNGPWVIVPLNEITGKDELINVVSDRLFADIKTLCEHVGWEVADETQPNNGRYFNLVGRIWKDTPDE